MTDNEKQALIGEMTEKLAQCIRCLNRARKEGRDLVSSLRILADCFDDELQDVNILKFHSPDGFTFTDKRDRTEKHRFPSSHSRVQSVDNDRPLVLVKIPNGESLKELVERIQNLLNEAEDLDGQLRNEAVDVKEISKALGPPD